MLKCLKSRAAQRVGAVMAAVQMAMMGALLYSALRTAAIALSTMAECLGWLFAGARSPTYTGGFNLRMGL